MSYLKLESKGYSIADNDTYGGKLRDIDGILADLRSTYDIFSTHSMNDTALVLHGVKAALGEVIEYLERV